METKFNYFWGLLGILGLLGYVLENPVYYAFFAFFLFFLIPVYDKAKENGEKKGNKKTKMNYDMYKISIWLGSAILLVDSFYLMATKTMNDFAAIGLLLGILIYVSSFFASIGMEKTARDERLRKIGTLAATWSWYITLVFVSFLVVSMYWSQRIHDPIELMGLTIFVMISTMLVANAILSRIGDIDYID
jgi:L-asparagine transporter-like permease